MVQEHHSYCPSHIPLAFYNILDISLRSPAVVKVMIDNKCANPAIQVIEYKYWKCLCQRKETLVLVELKNVQSFAKIWHRFTWDRKKTNPWLSRQILKTLWNFFQNICYVTVFRHSRGIGWRYDWLKSFAPRQSSKHINRPWNDFSRTRRSLHVHGPSCDSLIWLWFDFSIVCLIKVWTNSRGT